MQKYQIYSFSRALCFRVRSVDAAGACILSKKEIYGEMWEAIVAGPEALSPAKSADDLNAGS